MTTAPITYLIFQSEVIARAGIAFEKADRAVIARHYNMFCEGGDWASAQAHINASAQMQSLLAEISETKFMKDIRPMDVATSYIRDGVRLK